MLTKYDQLLKWQIGEVSDKIEIREGKFGNGIFATEKIESDQVVLKIQPENLITVDKLFQVQFVTNPNFVTFL